MRPQPLLRSILIGLVRDCDDEPSSALAYGISLARATSAQVTAEVATVRVVAQNASLGRIASKLVASQNQHLRQLATTTVTAARDSAAAVGVACTASREQLPYPALCARLAQIARVHDLTVMDADGRRQSHRRGLVEAVLFGSERPTVVVPATVQAFDVRRVVIGWDGSQAATRAVNNALPLLSAAASIDVVCVRGEKDLTNAVPGAELVRLLAGHGIAAEAVELPARDGDAAEVLREHAANTRAGLLLIGASIRGRLREALFGGVTQAMLEHCPTPLLLSH